MQQVETVQQKFSAALATLVDQVKRDRSVLAAILCGSLSHDTVWAKSDIDLVLVTVDDKKTADTGLFLYAATPLAKIEVLSARLLVDREVLPQAIKLNPAFFKTVYADMLNTKKTPKNVQAALSAIDDYLAKRTATLFAPVIDHLRDVG